MRTASWFTVPETVYLALPQVVLGSRAERKVAFLIAETEKNLRKQHVRLGMRRIKRHGGVHYSDGVIEPFQVHHGPGEWHSGGNIVRPDADWRAH